MNITRLAFVFFRLLLVLLVATHLSACGERQSTDRNKTFEELQAEIEKNKQKPLPKCREAKAGGPEDVVRALYRQYSYAARKDITHEPEEVIARFFDKKLTKLMLRIPECEKREGMCIDFDFMYDANALQLADFQVCAMDAGKNSVNVQFRNNGDPEIIAYKLTHTDVGWRISDALYSGAGGKWTLAGMLSKI